MLTRQRINVQSIECDSGISGEGLFTSCDDESVGANSILQLINGER